MRLIDADKLEPSEIYTGQEFVRIVYMDDIDLQPTVDTVKHGRWIRNNNYIPIYECCFCHTKFDHGGNYCGNCGAKMD